MRLAVAFEDCGRLRNDVAEKVTDRSVSATERLKRLSVLVTRTPIFRDVVAGVARQQDYMKRLRKNGGARAPLLDEGVALLWGGRDNEIIDKLGLTVCTSQEFISIKPINSYDLRLLRKSGHLQ